MHDDAIEVLNFLDQMKKDPQPWEFRSKPAWQRLIIMLGGVTVNIILGFLILGFLMLCFFNLFLHYITEIHDFYIFST